MKLIPVTGNELEDSLREYEAAHETWMSTSVFTDAGRAARENKDKARERYENAYRAANPSHILL